MLASSVAGAWEGVWVGLAEGRCSEKTTLRAASLLQKASQPTGGKMKREAQRFTLTLGKTALTFTRVGRQRSLF